jgi:hypothetical protein
MKKDCYIPCECGCGWCAKGLSADKTERDKCIDKTCGGHKEEIYKQCPYCNSTYLLKDRYSILCHDCGWTINIIKGGK